MKLTRILFAGMAVASLSVSGAQAADLLVGGFDRGVDPIYSSPLFNFEGFYLGVTGGGATFPSTGVVGTVGVVAGANFEVTDGIIAGVEWQGDTLWNGGGFVGFDTLFLGKLGGYISDSAIIYGTAGGGWIDGNTSYAFGAGIEAAVADQLSLRGELLGTGTWGGMPNGAKATVGLIWHMN